MHAGLKKSLNCSKTQGICADVYKRQGIYIGNNQIVHASTERTGIKVDVYKRQVGMFISFCQNDYLCKTEPQKLLAIKSKLPLCS